MTAQREPDPNNRFETWADGMTPSGHHPPTSGASASEPARSSDTETEAASSASEPPAWTPPSRAPEPPLAQALPSFPTYPYSAPRTPFANRQQEEAFAAFQGYQAGTGFPNEAMKAYRAPYNHGHPHRPTTPKSPYAVPSLVLGIVSVFCGGVTGPIGLGFGIAALKQIQAEPRFHGRGLAIAGIATSAFGTFVLLMVILGMIAG